MRPELPAGFEDAGVCAAALQRLCDSGQHGLVVMGDGGVLPRSWPRQRGRTLLWAGMLCCWPKGSPSTRT
jgi:hypothetical protein